MKRKGNCKVKKEVLFFSVPGFHPMFFVVVVVDSFLNVWPCMEFLFFEHGLSSYSTSIVVRKYRAPLLVSMLQLSISMIC